MKPALAVLVALCACGSEEGGGKKDKKERAPDCEDAVDRYAEASGRTKDRRDLARRCEKDDWTKRMRKCVAAAETKKEFEGCEKDYGPEDDQASLMEKLADEMCACKNGDCAQRIFERAMKDSTANEGKQVSARDAERYAKAGERISKCYSDIVLKESPKKDVP
jgi:hypothetical protein